MVAMRVVAWLKNYTVDLARKLPSIGKLRLLFTICLHLFTICLQMINARLLVPFIRDTGRGRNAPLINIF
jgi:hypothetical protein